MALNIIFSLVVQYWAGWNDNKDEGNFVNYRTGKVLRKEDGFWPWAPGEPNGGVMENCATVVTIGNDGWNDNSCSTSRDCFGFCEIQPRPRLILRGSSN